MIQKRKLQFAATVIISCLCSTTAFADSAAEQGLARLKANVDNSKANVESYQKNLQVVTGNLAEIAKARGQVEGQQKELNSILKQNQMALQQATQQQQQISGLIQKEEKDQVSDDQKLKDLEKMMAQIHENQEKRQQYLADYKAQLSEAVKEFQQWKDRQDKLNQQQKEMNDRVAAVKKMEKDWSNKKRGYEGELSRWQKETDKHEKLLQQYTSLAEHKE